MSRSMGTALRGAFKLVQNFVLVGVLALALAALVPASGPATAASGNPPGNNGTVKVAELGDMDAPPDNDPHVGCTFTVEWYGFDQGPDIISHVTFESQAPTADAVLDVTGPSEVFVGADPATGAGTPTGLDGREVYTLSFHGDPHPVQGYHVKLTVNTPGSQGADKKSKVFWVKGCQAPPPSAPAIHLEKTAADADGDGIGRVGEVLTYTMTVTNTGNTVLNNVTVTDTRLGLTNAPCVGTLAVNASTTCPLLPPLTHVVTAADVTAGSVANVATATGSPPSGPPVSDDDDATIPTAGGGPLPVDLAVVKTASLAHAAPGDQVTYTLKVTNAGPGTAHNVVVTDILPSGTTFVSASPACSNSAGTVTCQLGDVTAGDDPTVTITVKMDALPGAVSDQDHQLDVTKVESQLSIFGPATQSATTQCPAGYLATDGSVRLDHVDQGTGTFADAMVLRSEATADGTGWVGTIRNDTTGQLQAKVNVVCMSNRTVSGEDHSHPVVVTGPVSTTQTYAAAGDYGFDLTCGAGMIPITPGFVFTSGDGVVTSQPINGNTGRHFKVHMTHPGAVTGSIRCLQTDLGFTLGHTHQLAVVELTGQVDVGAHAIAETSLTCPVGYKGIVAWIDFPGVSLGNDPQPITRVFRFYNPTDSTLTASYGLTCVAVRTSGGNSGSRTIVNTAAVATSSTDSDPSDNSSSATVVVTPTGVTAGGSAVVHGSSVSLRVSAETRRTVRLSLVATHRVAGTGVRPGTVLASGVAHLNGTGRVVRLGATHSAKAALRQGKVHEARLVLRGAHGAKETQKIRLR